MPKTFAIILGITGLLSGFTRATGPRPHLIGYLLGAAMVGVLFGIVFGWIWTKTKNKFVKTVLVILSVMFVSKDLADIQSFIEKATFKRACSKNLRSKQNEASLFFNTIFLDFKSLFQEAKKANLRQVLDEVEKTIERRRRNHINLF